MIQVKKLLEEILHLKSHNAENIKLSDRAKHF